MRGGARCGPTFAALGERTLEFVECSPVGLALVSGRAGGWAHGACLPISSNDSGSASSKPTSRTSLRSW